MHSQEFQQQLGQLVLNAGFVESDIRNAILTLCRPNSKQASLLLIPQASISNKLELLKRVVISEINEANQKDWLDLIKDIAKLFEFRNQIFHSMPGMQDNEIYFFSIKKGKNGLPDEWKEKSINILELKEKNQILHDRHRQIMDFIEDYGKPINKYIASQNKYPILIGKDNV